MEKNYNVQPKTQKVLKTIKYVQIYSTNYDVSS